MENAGYWAVLPSEIRYNHKLSSTAKVIYAEITALSGKTGYCFAGNEYFTKLFGLSERSVIRIIKELESTGFIRVEGGGNGSTHRQIYAGVNPLRSSDKNVSSPGEVTKMSVGSDKNVSSPIINNKINNNPPIVPQKGDGAPPKKKRSREWKETAEHESERFEKFWKVYPHSHRGGRQPAIRAWDKLKPDEALLDEMAIGLDAQLKSREWKDGFGIPHASTWLNDHRWEGAADNAETPRPEPPPHDEGRKTTWI